MAVGGENYDLRVTVASLKLLVGRLFALQYRNLNLDPDHVPDAHEYCRRSKGRTHSRWPNQRPGQVAPYVIHPGPCVAGGTT